MSRLLATHKIATSFDRIDTAMATDSTSKETSGTDETIDRIAAWRGSIDKLGRSIGGLRPKCPQLPPPAPRQITNFETEITQPLDHHPFCPIEPQSRKSAAPLHREINKLEHEAFILRRIFGDRKLTANELKILAEVDTELAALRVKRHSDTNLSSCHDDTGRQVDDNCTVPVLDAPGCLPV